MTQRSVRAQRLLAVMLTCLAFLVSVSATMAAKFELKDFKGKFSFQLSGNSHSSGSVVTTEVQTVHRVGVIDSDGKGAITGRSITVLDDGTETIVVDYDWTGTYTIRDDGTGTLTINPSGAGQIRSCVDGSGSTVGNCEDALSAEHYAIVLIAGKDATTMSLVQTDAPAGRRLYLRGSASTQVPKKGGGGGSIGLF